MLLKCRWVNSLIQQIYWTSPHHSGIATESLRQLLSLYDHLLCPRGHELGSVYGSKVMSSSGQEHWVRHIRRFEVSRKCINIVPVSETVFNRNTNTGPANGLTSYGHQTMRVSIWTSNRPRWNIWACVSVRIYFVFNCFIFARFNFFVSEEYVRLTDNWHGVSYNVYHGNRIIKTEQKSDFHNCSRLHNVVLIWWGRGTHIVMPTHNASNHAQMVHIHTCKTDSCGHETAFSGDSVTDQVWSQ